MLPSVVQTFSYSTFHSLRELTFHVFHASLGMKCCVLKVHTAAERMVRGGKGKKKFV